MKVVDLKTSPIQGAYYFEDIEGLQGKSVPESERFFTRSEKPGFKNLRDVATGVSLGIKDSLGHWHWGDCISVSYAGKSGRENPLTVSDTEFLIQGKVGPFLSESPLTSYRETLLDLNALDLPTSIRYGVSQALISLFSHHYQIPMADVFLKEWNLERYRTQVPLHGSSGNNRHNGADKMIVNRLACLPHTQVDDPPTQLGAQGEILADYVRWLVRRLSPFEDYTPVLHLDVHGSIGKAFNENLQQITDYLLYLEDLSGKYPLRMESVALRSSKKEQIEFYQALKAELLRRGSKVLLVADEWANTLKDIQEFAVSGGVDMIHIKMPDVGTLGENLEAVQACKAAKVQSLLGGSCIETEISTRASVHLAMAIQPTELLAKPGMGIDESIMLTRNEMNRILSLWKERE